MADSKIQNLPPLACQRQWHPRICNLEHSNRSPLSYAESARRWQNQEKEKNWQLNWNF